jgi:hypothetical protein
MVQLFGSVFEIMSYEIDIDPRSLPPALAEPHTLPAECFIETPCTRSCGDGFKLLLPNPTGYGCYGATLQVWYQTKYIKGSCNLYLTPFWLFADPRPRVTFFKVEKAEFSF